MQAYGQKCSRKTELFRALCNAETLAQLALANLFCYYMLQNGVDGQPDDKLNATCIALINVINTAPNVNAVTQVFERMKTFVQGKNLDDYQALLRFLSRNKSDIVNNLWILSEKATKAQVDFCVKNNLDVEFLAFLYDNQLDASPQADPNAGGTVVTLSPAEIERGKLAPCDKLAAVGAVLSLYPRDLAGAKKFLLENQDALFALNAEMFSLFVTHARAKEVTDRPLFVRVLSQAKTREDNDFILAIFDALDLEQAMKAIAVLGQKSQKSLSGPQKRCVAVAFASPDANAEVKFQFLEAMFTVNFSPEALNSIARLYNILMDRDVFVKEIKSLKSTDDLLEPRVVDMLETLKSHGLPIDLEYARYLAGLQYLPQFNEVMTLFSDTAIQAIFNRKNTKTLAGDWVKAFMIQARVSQDPELQRKVIQLVFGLWTFAEANAQQIGMKQDDLLGVEFNQHFLTFIGSIDFEAQPEFRYALLADVKTAIGLIMPASQQPLAIGGSSISGLWGRLTSSSTTPLALPAPAMPDITQQIFRQLGVNRLEGIGTPQARWVFSSPEDLQGFGTWMRRANIRREAGLIEGPQSYLALMDEPVGVSVIEAANDAHVEDTSRALVVSGAASSGAPQPSSDDSSLPRLTW